MKDIEDEQRAKRGRPRIGEEPCIALSIRLEPWVISTLFAAGISATEALRLKAKSLRDNRVAEPDET